MAKVTQQHALTSMFALLLLASSVAAEWVEIAQNHYRKEPARRVTINYEDTAVANRIYTNHSLTERPWNHVVVTRSPNRGNVKRVQFPFKPKDKFSSGIISETISSTERTSNNRDVNFGFDRVSNIKRVDYLETKNIKEKLNERDKFKDKSVEINEKSNIRLHVPSQRHKIQNLNLEEHFKENEHKKIQEIKNMHDYGDDNRSIKPILTSVSKNQRVPIFEQSSEDFNNHSKDTDNKEITHIDDKFMSIDRSHNEKSKDRTYNIGHIGSFLPKDSIQSRYKHHQNIRKTSIDINVNKINKSYIHEEPDEEVKQETSTNVIKEHDFQEKNQYGDKGPNHDAFTPTDDNLDKSSKSSSVEVIWKLMKVVTDNISRNTRRSFRSKLRYLESLRNTILANIEERIEEVWPEETEGGARRKRSAAAEARGHVEFPSSESALMTISFLTFAVFLIKLVLQVIHTYKNKTMMVTPAVVAAVGRAAATLSQQLPRN